MSLAAGVCLLSSCKKDDWQGKRENPNPEPIKFDDSSLLCQSFLVLDENGEVEGSLYGSYDPAKPGVVTITVRKTNPVQWARDFMKSILPEDADISETEEELVWNMKDAQGKSQGQMIFKRSTAPGEFAAVEVPACAGPLTRVVFKKPMLTDSWQEVYNNCDALDPYYLGATINVRKGQLPEGTVDERFNSFEGDFLVVREYEAGVHSGLLVRLEDKEYNIITVSNSDKYMHQIRSTYYCVLNFIHKILDKNPAFRDTMRTLGMADWDNGFYYNTQGLYEARFNLKTTETTELNLFMGWYYREAIVYRFVPSEMDDGSIAVQIRDDRLWQEKF